MRWPLAVSVASACAARARAAGMCVVEATHAMEPQPAAAAIRRGPKSRAGLKPAWVSGEKSEMRTETMNPMKKGTMPGAGRCDGAEFDAVEDSCVELMLCCLRAVWQPTGRVQVWCGAIRCRTAGSGAVAVR